MTYEPDYYDTEPQYPFAGLAGKKPIKKTVAVAALGGAGRAWQWAMQFNYMNIAERLRFGFHTPEVASYNGVSKGQYQAANIAYQTARNKFTEAGGSEQQLQQIILGGWGNGNTSLQKESINKATLELIKPHLANIVRILTTRAG